MDEILIGIGSNLPVEPGGNPLGSCTAAMERLEADGIEVLRRSSWYRSAPVPASDQPDFVNGVAAVATVLDPRALLARLHALESALGRVRGERNAARVIDLDLLAFGAECRDGVAGEEGEPILPHPRLHERAFVLQPLREIAPSWRHPRTGETVDALIAALPAGQRCERFSRGLTDTSDVIDFS